MRNGGSIGLDSKRREEEGREENRREEEALAMSYELRLQQPFYLFLKCKKEKRKRKKNRNSIFFRTDFPSREPYPLFDETQQCWLDGWMHTTMQPPFSVSPLHRES